MKTLEEVTFRNIYDYIYPSQKNSPYDLFEKTILQPCKEKRFVKEALLDIFPDRLFDGVAINNTSYYSKITNGEVNKTIKKNFTLDARSIIKETYENWKQLWKSREGDIYLLKKAYFRDNQFTADIGTYTAKEIKDALIICNDGAAILTYFSFYSLIEDYINWYWPEILIKKEGLISQFSPFFVKREHCALRSDEISDIIELYEFTSCVVISSPGGIGKTTIASALFNRFKEKYSTYAWITFTGNILQDFRSQLTILNERDLNMGVVECWNVICSFFNGAENVFLVIDNLDSLGNDDRTIELNREALRNLINEKTIKLLITTRDSSISNGLGEVLPIKSFNDEYCMKIFESYSHRPIEEFDRDIILSIINKVEHNTLLIELIAGIFNEHFVIEHELLKALNKMGISATKKYKNVTTTYVPRNGGTVFSQLTTLLMLSKLTNVEKMILWDFSRLPDGMPVTKDQLNKYMGYGYSDCQRLVKLSLLKKEREKLYLHPLYKDIIKNQDSPLCNYDDIIAYKSNNEYGGIYSCICTKTLFNDNDTFHELLEKTIFAHALLYPAYIDMLSYATSYKLASVSASVGNYDAALHLLEQLTSNEVDYYLFSSLEQVSEEDIKEYNAIHDATLLYSKLLIRSGKSASSILFDIPQFSPDMEIIHVEDDYEYLKTYSQILDYATYSDVDFLFWNLPILCMIYDSVKLYDAYDYARKLYLIVVFFSKIDVLNNGYDFSSVNLAIKHYEHTYYELIGAKKSNYTEAASALLDKTVGTVNKIKDNLMSDVIDNDLGNKILFDWLINCYPIITDIYHQILSYRGNIDTYSGYDDENQQYEQQNVELAETHVTYAQYLINIKRTKEAYTPLSKASNLYKELEMACPGKYKDERNNLGILYDKLQYCNHTD